MVTTIQINDSTKQMLERIKEIENKPTFDDVITELAKDKLEVPTTVTIIGLISSFILDF